MTGSAGCCSAGYGKSGLGEPWCVLPIPGVLMNPRYFTPRRCSTGKDAGMLRILSNLPLPAAMAVFAHTAGVSQKVGHTA